MQGPPGTGKSQTIANIIAECIARGKTVLFVSDKMAALDVVHKRLSQVKLSSFCLELHSSKANKREVVNELKRCLEQQEHARNLPSNLDFEKMQSMRENLNNYVVSLHEIRMGLERSVYQVLGALSKLEAIPFFPVELNDVSSITPKRLSNLEGLIVQLKNVWQVAEETNFPWKGYKGSVYNLQTRMELISILDNLLRTMDKLKKETFTISAELGIDTPTTIDRVKWLVSITQLLSDTLKPERDWVVKSDLSSLINESENYKKFFEWRSTKRSYLSDKYKDSLFNLPIYTSNTLTNQLNDLKSLIKLNRPEEGNLLSKRQELIDFLSMTADYSEIWISDCNELAQNFGFTTEAMNIDQAKRLAQIAIECFSQEKPEIGWFDPSVLKALKDTLPKAKADFLEHNSLKNNINMLYTDKILDLEIEELIISYNGPYKSVFRYFHPSYYRDNKKIALVSKLGKVPDSIIIDLITVRNLKINESKIQGYIQSIQQPSGRYYKGFETNFDSIRQGLEHTERISSFILGFPDPRKS